MYNCFLEAIHSPKKIIYWVLRHFAKIIPDKTYIAWRYLISTGQRLDLNNPVTFNEKIQWLKLNDFKPIYTQMADKLALREYICQQFTNTGAGYFPILYGIWNSFDEIDFDKLPEQFVLKTTHDSGSVTICKEKKIFDINAAKKQITRSMKTNYYWGGRERQYKNIVPRIFAEEYLGENINDYKLFAFNGTVKAIEVDYDRFINHKRNIYTPNWEYMPLSIYYPSDPNHVIQKPLLLDAMIDIAEKLSQGIPHLRVDMYYVNNKIYIGELTFHHESGYRLFTPAIYEKIFGEWIRLPSDL